MDVLSRWWRAHGRGEKERGGLKGFGDQCGPSCPSAWQPWRAGPSGRLAKPALLPLLPLSSPLPTHRLLYERDAAKAEALLAREAARPSREERHALDAQVRLGGP
jgi:hypothetical protein